MSELKLSEFLTEHRASEFGLAPVSKAMAVQMAEDLEAKLKGRPSAEQFAIVLEDREKAEAKLSKMKEQLQDIPGVNLTAKISVLRLWAEPEMERLAEEEA